MSAPIYVVDSPGATVFHLLPDCAALQQAVNPIVTEYGDSLTAQVVTETRGLLPACDRCEDAARKLTGGYDVLQRGGNGAPPPAEAPAPPADGSAERPYVQLGEWKQNFLTLTLYESHVEIAYPLAANEVIPLGDIVELSHTTWIPLFREPRVHIAYDFEGERMETSFALDNDDDPAAVQAAIEAARSSASQPAAAPPAQPGPAPAVELPAAEVPESAGVEAPADSADGGAADSSEGSAGGEMGTMAVSGPRPGLYGLPTKAVPEHYADPDTAKNGCAQAALATLVMTWGQVPMYRSFTVPKRTGSKDRVDRMWKKYTPDTLGQHFGTTPAFLCKAAQDLRFKVDAFHSKPQAEKLKGYLKQNIPVIVLLDTGKFPNKVWFSHHYAVAHAYSKSSVWLANMEGLELPRTVDWDLFLSSWQSHALTVFGPQHNYLGIAAWVAPQPGVPRR